MAHTKIVYTFCIQKLSKIYIQLMYIKCIKNVFIHSSTNFCIYFVCKIKTMAAKNCIQNIYKILSKCRIHFFIETFCIILYILYTNILIYKNVHHKNYVYNLNLYTKVIQNVQTNNCMQNGSHIPIYFDLFLVHFLAS